MTYIFKKKQKKTIWQTKKNNPGKNESLRVKQNDGEMLWKFWD